MASRPRGLGPVGRSRRVEAGRARHRRGLGAVVSQPGRRLVWPPQGIPRPVRHVPAAAARSTRPRRAHSRQAQQLDARHQRRDRIMSNTKIIRYQTKPDRADDNARLIEAVFAELAESTPDGVRYAAFRLDDGVSFIHVVQLEGEDNPLSSVAAFQAFQADLGSRIAEGPAATDAAVVGSYRLFPG